MTANSKVYNTDCLDAIKEYPDNYFELAIVDPPYGIGADKPSIKPENVKQKNGSYLRVNSNKYQHKNWDISIPENNYFHELFRVSQNQIIWGANYFGLIGGYIVWDKLNGNSDQYGCELAYQSYNNRTDIVRFMWQGMFQGIYCGYDVQKAVVQQGNKKLNENRIHPTQKPVALYRWLLQNYAKPGDKILDTHLGSGSSRIAADMEGYDFTGYELDTDYFNASVKRFNEYKLQAKLL
jgi:site-specific DNA-methyltransferase (adenine-specific)